MLRFLLIILLLVAASAAAGAEDKYYYSDGRQIQLTPIDNKVVIGFAPIWGNQFSEFLTHYPQLVDTIQPSRIDEGYYIFYVYPGNNIDSLIDRLQQDTTVVLAQRVFTNELGGEEAFSNEIVVQTSGSLTPSEYDSVLTLYGL
jgi:hypothetical protein